MTAITASAAPIKKRLASLDALRGFDMFWIISGEEIFHGVANAIKDKYGLVKNTHNWRIAADDRLSFVERVMVGISNQLHHSPWNGFTFYDHIFPLFIFIAGISMAYAYNKLPADKAGKRKLYSALMRRTLLLIILGAVVNGFLKFQGYEQTRFASVLGRIALACFFAAIIYLNSSLRWQLIWLAGILLGYWFLLTQVPVPGHGTGNLTPDASLASYVDQHFLPGKLHRKVYDPEGLLATIPAVATALLGLLTGRFMLWGAAQKQTPAKQLGLMLLGGTILLLAGLAWGIVFPLNKTLWTSSFTLYAAGWSLLLFTLFYAVIDVAGYSKWCQPLVWIGSNSILIYIAAHGLVNFESTSQYLIGGLINNLPPGTQHALIWIGVLLIQLLLLGFLYRKKLFLKL